MQTITRSQCLANEEELTETAFSSQDQFSSLCMCKTRSSPFSLQVTFLKLSWTGASCSSTRLLGQGSFGGDLSAFLWPRTACTDQGKTISALVEQEPSWTKGNSSRNNIKEINSLQIMRRHYQKPSGERPEILKDKLPRKRSAKNSMGSTLKA